MSRILYSHKWIALREGLHGEAYISTLDSAGGSVIVPVLPSKLINLIVETSYVDGSRCVGLPAGTVEGDESPLESAKRELLEEAALVVRSIEHLGRIHLAQRYADLAADVFLAHVEPGEPIPSDEPYEITNLPRSWNQIDQMVKTGELTDSGTIASLYLARRALDERS